VRLEGSTVLVTGASSGIGAALAPLLAERGATVGIVARRRERLEEVLEQCRRHTPASRMWVADLGDLDAAARMVRDAWDAFAGVDGVGGLDAVVHNAGIPKRTPVPQLTFSDVTHVMDVDFHSPVRMTLELLPDMLRRGSGQFVFVSSMGGRTAIANEAAYNAAKFAMCGWAEAMYLDVYGTGVEVKLVLPGPIDTEIWDQPDNEPALFDIEKVPPRDCATDIANAMEADGFEFYAPAVYPGGLDAKAMVVGKTQDCDAYLGGMAQFAASLRTTSGG
jgi:short-subunit dehydrogenase